MKPKATLRYFLALAGSSLLAVSSAHAVDGTWSTVNDGTWSTSSNWAGSPNPVPGGQGSIISIQSNITGPRTVTIDTTSRTVGSLTIGDSSHGFTIAASGGASLIFDNGASNAILVENFVTGLGDIISAPVTLNSNLDATINGALLWSSDISGIDKTITKFGSGTLTFTGTNTYSGTTTINSGTLDLGGGTSTGSLASALALGGGTLSYTRTGNTTQNFATTAVNSGASTVSAVAGNTLGLGVITRSTRGTLAVGTTGTITTSNSNDATGILAPWVFYGTQYATVTGGTIGAYTGTTGNAEGDWFSATANYEITTTGTRTLTGNRTGNTFRYSGAGNGAIALGASGANTLTLNGLLAVGSTGTLTISRAGGTGSVVAGSTGEIVIAGSQAITISAPISSGVVTYSGTGTLTLSGANTYAGGFNLNSGTVGGIAAGTYQGFGSGKVTWTGGQITLNGGVTATVGNDFDLNGATLSVAGNNSTLNFDGIVTLKQDITLRMNNSTNDFRYVFNNSVGDGGNGYDLNIAAGGGSNPPTVAGGFTFNAVNTFTGDITIGSAGTATAQRTLVIGNNGALNSGNYAGNIANNNSSGSIIYSSSANQILSGVISGSAGLIKDTSSASTLTLTGQNTYTGTTTVSAGKLLVNNTTGSGTGSGNVTVGNGGTLGGSGIISGNVTTQNGGTFAAGTSIESLATGSLTQQAGSTFAYEANNSALGIVAGDLTVVSGNFNLDLTNAAILTLSELGSGSWDTTDKLTLLSYSGTWNGGLFKYLGNDVADDSSIEFSGYNWTFNYNDTGAGTNYLTEATGSRFVTMTAVSAIPEPSAALLGAIGLIALLRRRR